MKELAFLLLIALPFIGYGQKELLNAGPMPGYSEMKEVAIWFQTKKGCSVFANYWDIENPKTIYPTNIVETSKSKAFTGILIADSVEPGRKYAYELIINGKKIDFPYALEFQTQPIWKWRGDPPNLSFLMGCGTYINESSYDRPGQPYGGGYEIYGHMAKMKSDFMLWLGDNVYLREPDWNSWTGIVHRYTHDRGFLQLQEFLASTHHYAIWDDHDYGPNNSDRSFWNKNQTMEAFKLFWANPSYGVGDIEGAITYFNWGDADFFLLDNRTYRSPDNLDTTNKTQLGEKQLQWLFDNLASSYATIKFVVMGGQFLTNSGVYEAYTNYRFNDERQKIIDFIYTQNIRNVVFLTGDVHFSEISVLKQEGKPVIWDITSSPMNSGVNTRALSQNNTLRIPGSVIMERNFTQLNISGPETDRKIEIVYFDVNGDELYRHSIEADYGSEKK